MNLKKYLDAANAAEARVQMIAAQIDQHFEVGEAEKALALKPELNSAKEKAKESFELYTSMVNATAGGNDPARQLAQAANVQVVLDEADRKFRSPGEFFQAVKNAELYPKQADPRLKGKIVDASGMSEAVPSDGGYLLPSEVAGGIQQNMLDTGAVVSRISLDPVAGNSMTYNLVDESSRASSLFGGVVGYWMQEAGSITSSFPKFKELSLRLKKVAALCYATDELLADANALQNWLTRNVPQALTFYVEQAIMRGDGIGKPLGILSGPGTVSVTRVDANKIQIADVSAMWARRLGNGSYAWLVNRDAMPQLMQLGSTYQYAWMPPGSWTDSPYARLLGAPVIEVEHCSSLGTVGDIVLADLAMYQGIQKGGVETASSIHVKFATDETAFRFVYRFDGAPLLSSALTPAQGSNTQSPFVTLSTSS